MDTSKSLSLADFGSMDAVLTDVAEKDKESLIRRLCGVLAETTGTGRTDELVEAVLNRESLGATAEPPGLAFPHARVAFISRPCFAFARLPLPVLWDAERKVHVRLVFLMATPLDDASMYLKLLSGIGRVGRSPHVFESLIATQDRNLTLEILRQIKVR